MIRNEYMVQWGLNRKIEYFKANLDSLIGLSELPPADYSAIRALACDQADDAIVFANVTMKDRPENDASTTPLLQGPRHGAQEVVQPEDRAIYGQ
ncbi:hypothetical protein LTR28_011396 [Elasticomyces elasticus]|nr:hypothetical protein LTR28_011396 [Elasticomyces elasticus]